MFFPYSLWDCKESDVTEHTHTNASAFEFSIIPLLPFQAITGQLIQQHSLICCQVVWLIGEGNGTPLQYSCLENPMDGGAW